MANLLGNHRVHWSYQDNSGKKTVKKTTICTIKNSNDEIVAVGEASLFHKDIPDRKVARAITFRRAMANIVNENKLDKETRANIWNDFRTKINQPETI